MESTEKVKICPAVLQARITDTDKASCKVNRKRYFSRGHGAVVKCHNDSLGSLLLSDSLRNLDLENYRLQDTLLFEILSVRMKHPTLALRL